MANNASHIANLNPLRYRSYVYDNESGFYYLMSRYYDPTTGRFLSPDSQLNLSTMHGCNLYAYCENDPVNRVDPTGRSAILALFVITAVSGFFACASPAGQARTEEAFSNPSFYSIGNWLTMGAFGMVKGAVAPAQPFSAQHWIDSAGTAMLLMPAIGFADDVIRSGLPASNTIRYTDKVVSQMNNPNDLNHSFPTLIDTMVNTNKYTPIVGGDGITRKFIQIPGSINNKPGMFEYIIDFDGWCNHRYFNQMK